jgi:hypothetical protein
MDKIASPVELAQSLVKILVASKAAKPSRVDLARTLRNLADRVAGVRIGSAGTPLYGHKDENSAYLVEDYPYGFKLRCNIRYWLEFKPKKGWRFMSQTQDPRNERWNKPKASTYCEFGACMYLDSQKHVTWKGITPYTNGSEVLEFVESFPNSDFSVLRQFAKAKIDYLQKSAEGKVVWHINNVPQPVTEEDMGRAKKDLDLWNEILKHVR